VLEGEKIMNEQTEKLIRELAEKLGTTVDHLWGVLIRQAYINSLCDLVTLVLAGVLVFFLAIGQVKLREKYENSNYEEIYFISRIFLTIFIIIYIFALFYALTEIITGFINPEYWALHKLLDLK
jgi:hypothetical protein